MDEKHHYECGFYGTLDSHFDNCENKGWKCLEEAVIKFGKGNEFNRKKIIEERKEENFII